MDAFLKMARSESTLELIKHPNALALLCLIAQRARRTESFSADGLQIGEALVGDHNACGLTARQYRTAKDKLSKWGLCGFKATNRGTIATILNTEIFDINPKKSAPNLRQKSTSQRQAENPKISEGKSTSAGVERQASDKPATTNKNEENNHAFSFQEKARSPGCGVKQKKHFTQVIDSKMVVDDIKAECRELDTLSAINGKHFNGWQFTQEMLRNGYHPEGIAETLRSVVNAWDTFDGDLQALARAQLKIVSQNYYERDNRDRHNARKDIDQQTAEQIIARLNYAG